MATAAVMAILRVFKLLLPALFPSWRFFDVIAPSPRIEIAFVETPEGEGMAWRPVRPPPQRLSASALVSRLFWNPWWNETLFMASCAERLIQNPTEHSSQEISRRIGADLAASSPKGEERRDFFRFRLVFVSRHEGELRRDVTFLSPAYPSPAQQPGVPVQS